MQKNSVSKLFLLSFSMDYDYNEDEVLSTDCTLYQIFKKFLIGSRVCEKLTVKNFEELMVIAQVAVTHPSSLQQLRQVQNENYIIMPPNGSQLMQRVAFFNPYFKVNKNLPANYPYDT